MAWLAEYKGSGCCLVVSFLCAREQLECCIHASFADALSPVMLWFEIGLTFCFFLGLSYTSPLQVKLWSVLPVDVGFSRGHCYLVQVPGPEKWLILGVSFTHSVESRDLFFLEAEIADNIFQWDVLKNMRQIKSYDEMFHAIRALTVQKFS